ncbi:MAG: efflux RND transporter permease subunit, partial [Acetobacteraceae bacterium]
MFQFLVTNSIRHRVFVLVVTVLLVGWGTLIARNMPIDLMPETRQPSVIVTAEAGTLAAEEVEQLIVQPIEAVMAGIPGITAVRSVSNASVAYFQILFAFGTDPFRNRQMVSEKLALARERLPDDIVPILAPMSAATGLVMHMGVVGGENVMALREYVDWVLRPRLAATEGVAQVFPVGGEVRTYRFTPNPTLMQHLGISLIEVERALSQFASNTSGGFSDVLGTSYSMRNIGRTNRLEDMRDLVVAYRNRVPVLLSQIGEVGFAPRVKRGDGAFNGKPAVNLSILKQPSANTVQVADRVEALLKEMQRTAPPGVILGQISYNQADMVKEAIVSVGDVLRDAIIIVAVVLILFLGSLRPTIISLLAIPISLVATAMVFNFMDVTLNTMTLGGIAIGIGALVDDAVVNVENILRRLGENRKHAHPAPVAGVIAQASQEVRSGIVYATLVILVVFIPLLAMPGQPGRMFAPLAIAFITSIVASLIVSITVTPALAYYLLPGMKALDHEHGGPFARWLKRLNARALGWVMDRPDLVIGATVIAVLLAAGSAPFLPRSFLPQFNEGNVYVTLRLKPGISIAESFRIGHLAEQILMQVPEVKSLSRRSGRYDGDSDVDDVNDNEIPLRIKLDQGRSLKELMEDIRHRMAIFAADLNVTQFLVDRMQSQDNMVRGDIVLKVFGPDLPTIRTLATRFSSAFEKIPGLTDISVEHQDFTPQQRIVVDYEKAELFGITPAQVTQTLGSFTNGRVVSQVIENGRRFDVVIRLRDEDRTPDALQRLRIETPSGSVPISSFARFEQAYGPSRILREDGVRRIAVMINTDGTQDTAKIVARMREIIDATALPIGYRTSLEGDFRLGEEGRVVLSILTPIAMLLIFLLLYQRFNSVVLCAIIMGNIPLALVGSVAALWIAGLDLDLAAMIGFIAVTGVAVRNSLLKVSHFINLHLHEGMPLSRTLILRGSAERLIP